MAKALNNGPNTNIFAISEIKGLASQINEKLESINYDNPQQLQALNEARGKLALWQGNQLYELQKVFE